MRRGRYGRLITSDKRGSMLASGLEAAQGCIDLPTSFCLALVLLLVVKEAIILSQLASLSLS